MSEGIRRLKYQLVELTVLKSKVVVVLFLYHRNAVWITNHSLQCIHDIGCQRCALVVEMV